MAHWRTRYVENEIRLALKWSPCIVLLGMRQTGKTSLLRRLSKHYLTFDDDALPSFFEREGDALLNQGPFPLALDEIQKYAKVFNRIKLVIDQIKIPGRFILTGSVRFSQKKDIRESLTGRTAPFELFPLTLAECHKRRGPLFLTEVLEKKTADFLIQNRKKVWVTLSQMKHYQFTGGLPGICFKRDLKIRNKLFEQHLDTLLGRDIHLLFDTKINTSELRDILSYIFSQQGLPITLASIGRQFGYSAPTIRRIITAFEGLFLIRKVGDVYYAEDQGLAHFCSETLFTNSRSYWLGLLHHEIRSQISLMDAGARLTEYRSRGGAEVPFIIHVPGKGIIAITLDSKERPSEKNLKSLGSISKKQKGECRLIAFHLGKTAYLSTRQILCLPVTWIA